MAELFGLKEVLAEEVRLLEALVDREEKTVQILIEGNARALQDINLRKEELLQRVKEMEKQRSSLLSPGLTLKELCRGESPAEAGELEKLRRRILQLHASLQRLLKVNRHLLKHNLQFVEHVLNVLSQRAEGPLYASSGQLKERAPFSTRFLDSNA